MPEEHKDDKPNKGGRPEFAPTEEQRQRVMIWTAGGLPQKHIARILNLSEPTLRKHFRKELEDGLMEANAMVMHACFINALTPSGKSDRALWLKCRAGWTDKQVVEVNNQPEEQATPVGEPRPETWGSILNSGDKRPN